MKPSYNHSAWLFLLLLHLGMLSVGCDDSKGSADATLDVADTTEVNAEVSDTPEVADVTDGLVLSGVSRRSADIASGGDGIGTLCISLVDLCPMDPSDLSFTAALSGLAVADADFSAVGADVPFQFELASADLPDGSYVVFGSLREASGTCDAAPQSGDLVSLMLLGGAACPEITVAGAGEIQVGELYLNGVVP